MFGALAIAPSPATAIIGGQEAPAGAYGYQVSIQTVDDGHICGGSVISQRYVLSAAHCVDDLESPAIKAKAFRVRIRSNNRKSGGVVHRVRHTRVHPDYYRNQEPDVALFKLVSPTSQAPVPFAGQALAALADPGRLVTVTGWGYTSNKRAGAPVLMRVGNMSISPERACRFDKSGASPKVTICAAGPGGVPDSCEGDSGGPLVTDGPSARVQVGIVSFGGERCGDPKQPGAYVRIPAVADWIARYTGMQPTR